MKTVYWIGWSVALIITFSISIFAIGGIPKMDPMNYIATVFILVVTWSILIGSGYLFINNKNTVLAKRLLIGFYFIIFIIPTLITYVSLLFD